MLIAIKPLTDADRAGKSSEQIDALCEAQAVATVNGRDVTKAQLSAAFDRVADAGNWKLPIDRVISVREYAELDLILDAIAFFAGGEGKANARGKNGALMTGREFRITAPGYYKLIGA